MSKTPYVSYGGIGFWAYDDALTVLLKHLVQAAKESDLAETPWLAGAISYCSNVACIPDLGLALETTWSADQRQRFLAVVEKACGKLGERPSIPASEIEGCLLAVDLPPIELRSDHDIPTAPVIELGRAIASLVSCELPEAPEGFAWCYTFEGRETIGWTVPGLSTFEKVEALVLLAKADQIEPDLVGEEEHYKAAVAAAVAPADRVPAELLYASFLETQGRPDEAKPTGIKRRSIGYRLRPSGHGRVSQYRRRSIEPGEGCTRRETA